jgi:azurin
MKHMLFIACLSALILAAGCDKPDFSKAAASGPVVRANGVAQLTITGNDQMKFDVTAFTVKSGETVRITFKNVGTMPVNTMGHDLVILKQGQDYKQFASEVAAQQTASGEHDALPASLADQVIGYTNILGPGEQATIEFKAPAPGAYPYLCTFPGHFVFMNGVMTVE